MLGVQTRSQTQEKDSYCILDCIYHGPDRTYYVVDVMCWKAYQLFDSTTQFRCCNAASGAGCASGG